MLNSSIKIEVPPTTLHRGEQDMSHTYKLRQQHHWNNLFGAWKLPLYFTKPVPHHIKHTVEGMLSSRFTGTLIDIHRERLHHRDRRTLSYFLSHGN